MRVAVYHGADELERAGGGETDLPDCSIGTSQAFASPTNRLRFSSNSRSKKSVRLGGRQYSVLIQPRGGRNSDSRRSQVFGSGMRLGLVTPLMEAETSP